MDQGDPRVAGQGPQQGRGGAEGEVLEVEDADGGRVQGYGQGLAEGGDVAAEHGTVQALAPDRQQLQAGRGRGVEPGGLEHEGAGGDEGV